MTQVTGRPTVRERVRGLAKKGLTQSEAARELGVSRQRISQLAAKLHLSFRPSGPDVPRKRFVQLTKQGLTRTEAARDLGMSLGQVDRITAELGVSFTPAWARPKPAATDLGRILQEARLARGYSYTRLGALSGLHDSHIRAIERGLVRGPREKTLRALADALDVSYHELVLAVPPTDRAVLGQQARELARKGLTKTEAARQMGVSRERLRVLAAKLDLTFAPFRREPKAPVTEFGRVMQEARLASGYSYAKLAALSGLHRRHVMALEGGRVRHPKEKTLRALADALGGRGLYKKLLDARGPS